MPQSGSAVSIVRTGDDPSPERVADCVRQAIDLVGGLPEAVKPGSLVLLKPNMVVVPADTDAGICTHVEVTKAVADLVAERGARPVIAEAAAGDNDTFDAMRVMGYDVLRDAGYELVDLNREAVIKAPLSGGKVWTSLDTFELVMSADAIISLPVLKFHCQANMTCALKNMMGLMERQQKREFHYRGLWDSIGDANALLKPCFAVVDALTVMEGLGPAGGFVVPKGLIMAGADLVAVDATGARLMDMDPYADVEYIMRAEARGLGVAAQESIDIVGEPLEGVRFHAMRPDEDPRPKWDQINLIRGKTRNDCIGCYISLAAALPIAENREIMDAFKGRTYIIGDAELPEGVDPDEVVPIGICCRPELQELPRFAPGCVPNTTDIVNNSQ